jgi:DNA helicase-2/ATP-dependent DNA helicase PcrA
MNQRDFQVGDRVRHPEFGIGLVLEALGKGEQAAVIVSFDDKSRRKLAVRFAKLTLVEPPSAPGRKS